MTLRFRRLALIVCLVLAGACSKNDEPPPPAAAPPAAPASTTASSRPRIVALGDSLTAGLGLVESQAYPALLQKKIDADGYKFEVVNAGVSGDTSAGGLRRLEWGLEGDVKVLILALGANDGLRGLSVDEMKHNLAQIIDRAREKNIAIILAGMEAPPNYGEEYATSFRAAFASLAREKRVPFIPFLLKDVAGLSHLNQGDGIHPNAEGAAVVSETMWAALKPLLDQMSK